MKTSRRNPEDQRVRTTKRMLRDALISLLAQKRICDIRVKELCEKAFVNRSTFYAHYKDIKTLAKEMEMELLRDLDGMLRRMPVVLPGEHKNEVAKLTEELFDFFEKHKDFCAVLLGPYGNQCFIQAVIEKGRGKAVREYMRRYPSISKQRAEIAYTFLAWGVLGILNYSVANNLPAETTAEALACSVACEMGYLTKRE